MTTIILTIIGILLAAAAALMVIFYGGDAFNSGSVGAQANTYQNAGTNVIAATQLFKADGNTAKPTIALLKAGDTSGQSYLKEDPALPSGSAGDINAAGTVYLVTGVSKDVCLRVNKNLKRPAAEQTTVPTAQPTAAKMGCFGDGSASNSFYASL